MLYTPSQVGREQKKNLRCSHVEKGDPAVAYYFLIPFFVLYQ